MAGLWKPKFGFAMPSLAKTTYLLLKEITTETNRTQWEVITIALHALVHLKRQRNANPAIKELLRLVVEETKDLKPNQGQFIDHEHERQTNEENGGL